MRPLVEICTCLFEVAAECARIAVACHSVFVYHLFDTNTLKVQLKVRQFSAIFIHLETLCRAVGSFRSCATSIVPDGYSCGVHRHCNMLRNG